MATENTTNNKNVTVSQLQKSLARVKTESDKAIAAVSGGEIATDAEIDAMLAEVFGPETAATPGGEENA